MDLPRRVIALDGRKPLGLPLHARFTRPNRPISPAHRRFATKHFPLLALLFFLALRPPCAAGEMVSVTPTRVPLHLMPGEPATVAVTIINQGERELLLRPQVLEVLGGEDDPAILTTSERCSWVEAESEGLSLEPRSRREFSFLVRPPDGTPEGTYRFALAFIPYQELPGTIAFAGGLAVLLELEVLPPPPPEKPLIPYIILALGLTLAFSLFVILRIRMGRKTGGGGGRNEE